MTSARRLYLALKFEGIWPITGEGRVVGVTWSVVVLTGSRERGMPGLKLNFFSAQNPIPRSDVTHI